MDTISFVYRHFIDVDILFGYIAKESIILGCRNFFCLALFFFACKITLVLDSAEVDEWSLLMLVEDNSNNIVVALESHRLINLCWNCVAADRRATLARAIMRGYDIQITQIGSDKSLPKSTFYCQFCD